MSSDTWGVTVSLAKQHVGVEIVLRPHIYERFSKKKYCLIEVLPLAVLGPLYQMVPRNQAELLREARDMTASYKR